MRTSHIVRGAAAALLMVGIAGCTPANTGNLVNANQAQAAQSVSFGTVTNARNVTLQGGNAPASVTGTIAGGIVGGLLGNQVGGGLGRDIATAVGATAGAAAGNAAANAATTQASVEWTVELESGRSISVIQSEPMLSIGQRVQVIQSGNGTTRLQPA